MAAESYWRYPVDPRQQAAAPVPVPAPAPMWQQAGYQPAASPVALSMATPPLPTGPPPSFKHLHPVYFDKPSGQENGLFHEAMSPHYGHHLNNQRAQTVAILELQGLNQELYMWKEYLRTAQRERLHVDLMVQDFSSNISCKKIMMARLAEECVVPGRCYVTESPATTNMAHL